MVGSNGFYVIIACVGEEKMAKAGTYIYECYVTILPAEALHIHQQPALLQRMHAVYLSICENDMITSQWTSG